MGPCLVNRKERERAIPIPSLFPPSKNPNGTQSGPSTTKPTTSPDSLLQRTEWNERTLAMTVLHSSIVGALPTPGSWIRSAAAASYRRKRAPPPSPSFAQRRRESTSRRQRKRPLHFSSSKLSHSPPKGEDFHSACGGGGGRGKRSWRRTQQQQRTSKEARSTSVKVRSCVRGNSSHARKSRIVLV